MRKKSCIFFLIFILLIFSNIIVVAPDIDIISKDDFYLKDYKEFAEINSNHYLNISFDKDFFISKSDISYKLIGNKEDIAVFKDCVDISYNIIGKDIFFVGTVKKWGVYHVDIVPVIKNSLELTDYIWWNSSFNYFSSSKIADVFENATIMINISNSTGGNLVIGSHHQINFSDIRFVKNNVSELYHWIEYISLDGSYAYFWININNSTVSDTINCYYGSTETLSNSSFNNPYKTFIFFEPFNDLGNWSNTPQTDFIIVDGFLRIHNTVSNYEYIYHDLNDDSIPYYLRTRSNCTIYNRDNELHGVKIATSIISSFSSIANEIESYYYDYVVDANLQIGFRNSANSAVVVSQMVSPDNIGIFNLGFAGWDRLREIRQNNMNIYVTADSVAGMNDYPDIINIVRRYGGTDNYETFWDYLFIGEYHYPMTSFVNWSIELSYCECSNLFFNMSPYNNEVVSGLNISYLTVEYQIFDGEADSINISIVADNGLFYINDTTNVFNGTYSLNVMLANFSVETNYIWFVNITNGGCFVSRNYTFQVSPYNLYSLLQVISYKENSIYLDMIKGDDDLDINIGNTLLMFLIWIFLAYIIFKTRSFLESLPIVACFMALSGLMIQEDLYQGLFFIVISSAIALLTFIRLFKKT